jgi:hypothetical protein
MHGVKKYPSRVLVGFVFCFAVMVMVNGFAVHFLAEDVRLTLKGKVLEFAIDSGMDAMLPGA